MAWELVGFRREVTASLKERTELALKFNQRVREFSESEGITFVSLDKESLGHNGLIDQSLVDKRFPNIHYDMAVYSKILKSKLKGVI